MDTYIVMCRVSGGVTGTREAPYKRNGTVVYFPTKIEADAAASRMMAQTNGNQFRTANFRYWVEEA